jgi:hypothetical protein
VNTGLELKSGCKKEVPLAMAMVHFDLDDALHDLPIAALPLLMGIWEAEATVCCHATTRASLVIK